MLKKNNIDIFLYDIKTEKDKKVFVEIRIKDTDVKELCHTH